MSIVHVHSLFISSVIADMFDGLTALRIAVLTGADYVKLSFHQFKLALDALLDVR